jgi:16S rRNA C967 or C1407 C5-methylase (RsmB/RsmF family)
MSPFENDEVVEKALKKSRTEPVAIKISTKLGRATKYGIQILPHEAPFGPLYVSKLKIQE